MKKLIFLIYFLVSLPGLSQGTVNGSIVADLSVSSSGGVNYSVPINVPPGLNGIQPDISLDFDSHSGNGLAGWGWNLSGVSVITRIPSTMFHDNLIDPVDFDLDDRFAFDGQRLILKTGMYGVGGSEYQTEQYSNLKIVAYGSNPISGVQGPEYFKVFYPDGSIAHYGSNTNSRNHTDYAITKWENPQGIRISYEYETVDNSLRIYKIKYGSRGDTVSINEIEFTYEARKFREVAYVGGEKFIRDHILDKIKIRGNGQQYREYDLSHSYSSFNYQRLDKIREYTGDLSESRDIDFKYHGSSFSSTEIHNVTFDENPETTQINLNHAEQRNARVVSLDFNGNGKMDFVAYSTLGTNAKKEFWLYEDIQSSIDYSSAIDEGKFVEMFPVNWLDDQNRLRPSQALALIQNTGTDQVDFRIMAKPTVGSGDIATAYVKTWDAPTYKPQDYYLYGNSNIYRVPLRYISGDFDGDGLSDVIALERNYTSSECMEYPSVSDPNCQYKVFRNGTEYCCYGCGNSTNNTTKAHLIKLDRRITSGFASSVGSLGEELKATDKLLAMDVTGDGRTNIVRITYSKIIVYGLNDTNSVLTELWEIVDSSIDTDMPPLPGDYNGDGKGDIFLPLSNNSASFLMFLSSGTDYQIENYNNQFFTFKFNEISGGTFYGHNLIPVDINGDGKTDIVEYNTEVGVGNTTGTQYIRVHQNAVKNASFDKPDFVPGNPVQDTVNMEAYPIPIFLSSDKPNSNLEFASLSHTWVRSYEFLKDHREDVTLKEIDNNGVVTTIKYDHVNIHDNANQSAAEPGYFEPSGTYTQTYPFVNVNVAPSFKVVKEFERVGAGFTRKQQLRYEGAISHTTGLGFMGFEVMKQSNWFGTDVPELWTISKYDPLLRGAIKEKIVSSSYDPIASDYMSKVNYFYDYKLIANPGSPIAPHYIEDIVRDYPLPSARTDEAEVSITLEDGFHAIGTNGDYWGYIVPPNEQPGDVGYAGAVDIRLNRTESDNGLTGVFTTEAYTYDQYNNPLTTVTTYPGGSRTVTNTYLNNPTATNSAYHIGRLQKMIEKVILNGNSFQTEEQYTYNNNLVTKVKKKGNGTGWLTEDFTHFANGNIHTKTLSGNEVPTRTETFEYNDSPAYGERFLTKSTDGEGFETIFEYYTDTGNLKKVTDIYGLVTSYEYDKWDRIKKETDYLLNVTDHTYTVLTAGALRHNVDYATGAKEQTTYNAFGWTTQTGTLSLGSQWVYKDFEYYLDGKSRRESEPHNGSPSQWNTTVYDGYGRPISQTLYTGKNITYTYAVLGLWSKVDDGIKNTKTTLDALGNIIKVEDLGGTVDYTYFANGTMKTADYGGNVVSVGIDGWGRKTSLTDPSAGSYSYAYNDYGELLTQTTPKGSTTYAYDDYGRVTSEIMTGDLTDHSLTYVYDPTTKLLTDINGSDNTNSRTYTYKYEYDNYERLDKVIENTGLASFEIVLDYDAYGRIEKESQTSTLVGGASKIVKTKNVYDTSGLLKEIWNDQGTPKKLWELGSINARGQALTINLGNGMTKTKVYDAYGYLTKIEDKEGGSGPNPTVALHTEYDFHQQRGILNSRENFGLSWQETFGYDNMDRLTTITGDVTHTMTYEVAGVKRGNIQNNSALGDYNYANSSKKYRLTSIDPNATGETYFQQHPTQNIGYNAFKKPVDIHQQGHGRVSFEYGPMMARSTAYYGGEQSNKTQRRYKKHYSSIIPAEIVEDAQAGTTKIITYVAGDAYSAPIAHIKTTGPGSGDIDEYHYLHRDYLGSILAITDADGDVKEERQFGAWGIVDKFLDSNSGTTFDHGSLLGRGYTGHEHFFEVGLIHMNGRMYDSQLGRFLSPDNFIQESFNTQSYNRYSYVLNNPLIYTDPSGEIIEWLGIAAFIILAGTQVAIDNGWFDGGSAYVYGAPVGEPPSPKMNTNNSNMASSAGRDGPRESRGRQSFGLPNFWQGFKNFARDVGNRIAVSTQGALNAWGSNQVLGAGRLNANTYEGTEFDLTFRAGQLAGDIASIVTGYGEILLGEGLAAGGVLGAVPSVGSSLTVSAAGVGIAVHGSTSIGFGAYNGIKGVSNLVDYFGKNKNNPRQPKMGDNRKKNEEVTSLIKKYKLNREHQRKLHDYITGENYTRKEIEEIIKNKEYLR